MPHKPFHLIKRPTTKNGKFVYYVKFYDEYGNRVTARSSGQSTKSAAETWAYEQLKRGLISTGKDITFGKYAEDWWVWGKCRYLKSQQARGKELSQRYADEMRSLLIRHILPYFKNNKLRQINKMMVEDWLLKLREKPNRLGRPLSATTVNNCFACFRIMMNQADEWDLIEKAPLRKSMLLAASPEERGVFNIAEVSTLFKDDSVNTVWGGNLKYFTANLVSLTTGMREGVM
jgi:hypothetical protein